MAPRPRSLFSNDDVFTEPAPIAPVVRPQLAGIGTFWHGLAPSAENAYGEQSETNQPQRCWFRRIRRLF